MGRGAGEAWARLGGWVFPGGAALPLRTPTLPPATHTNTLFIGRDRVWVVDPGGATEAGREALRAAVTSLQAPVVGVVLTHHHPDHVGSAAWLRDGLGIPVLAHARTAARLKEHRGEGAPSLVTDTLDEGDELDGGGERDRWRVLHTPGHAPGHLVLWQPRERGLLAGDMVAAVGTILVEPPDGDMALYLASLRRLSRLDPAWIVPAHGPLVEPAAPHLQHYIDHRLARERAVLDAVRAGATTLQAITASSYPELPAALHALAARSALAHLVKLRAEGRVRLAPEDEGGGPSPRARWAPSGQP